MKILKSIGSILAGIAVGASLSIGTDAVLEHTGVFPPGNASEAAALYTFWMLLLAAFYRSIYTVLAGYVTAALAPSNKMAHIVILGSLNMLACAAGMIAMLGKSPLWYPVVLIVLSLPCVWLGAKLRLRNV